MDLSSCQNIVIAWYPHLVPIVLAMFLSTYALIRTKASKLAVLFFAFTLSFSVWLVGDLVDWTQPYYDWVYFTWSWLDFMNVVFFVLGAFFFGVLAREKVTLWEKIAFVLLCVPAFLITVTGQSVIDFYQPYCEATNNDALTNYKLFAEIVSVFMMVFSLVVAWGTSDGKKRVQLSVIFGAIVLFFAVFSGTEYIASTTGVYEISLYGLFVLPLFLIIMTFAITDLKLFQFRFLGTQILAYVLIIIVGSQLLYVQDSTNRNLSLITLAISLFLALLLLENAKREAEARLKIEALAQELNASNKQQVILIHFITHQIKGFVSKSRNIFSLMLDGDYGVLPEPAKAAAKTGFESDTKGAQTIAEILNAANIRSGKVSYAMEAFDLAALIEGITKDLQPLAATKGLSLTTDLAPVTYTGDKGQLVNAFKNLIDNSIKYTPKGEIRVSLTKYTDKVQLIVQDTGIGIDADDMKNLFTEGGRGKNSQKVNVESTGFGLYIVKNIVEAHKGRVWAESEGEGKGSRFIIELPLS